MFLSAGLPETRTSESAEYLAESSTFPVILRHVRTEGRLNSGQTEMAKGSPTGAQAPAYGSVLGEELLFSSSCHFYLGSLGKVFP